MTAWLGTLAILSAYFWCGWIGYNIGVERGIRKEQTKRGIGRAEWRD